MSKAPKASTANVRRGKRENFMRCPGLVSQNSAPLSFDAMVIYELLSGIFRGRDLSKRSRPGSTTSWLGADTLWLLPVHPSGRARSQGSHGSPFAVRDHMAVHPDQGTMEDFKRLVRSCHDKGLRVVLDWVANHTAWDHPGSSRTLRVHGPGWHHHPPQEPLDRRGRLGLRQWRRLAFHAVPCGFG